MQHSKQVIHLYYGDESTSSMLTVFKVRQLLPLVKLLVQLCCHSLNSSSCFLLQTFLFLLDLKPPCTGVDQLGAILRRRLTPWRRQFLFLWQKSNSSFVKVNLNWKMKKQQNTMFIPVFTCAFWPICSHL